VVLLENKQRGVALLCTHAMFLPLAITLGDLGATGGGFGGLYAVWGTLEAATTGGSRLQMSPKSFKSCEMNNKSTYTTWVYKRWI
jgi:hypothetical protein